MAESHLLLKGLLEYRESLDKHLRQLNQDFQQLENEWRLFSGIYEGEAAKQFRSHWQRTAENFKEYIERSERIAKLLDERIDHLQNS